jgi:replicative DNA helicase
MHDHATGVSAFANRVDLLGLCRNEAMTAAQAASILFDTNKPTEAEKQKARRKLGDLVEKGLIKRVPAISPGAPDLYAAATVLSDYVGAPEAAQAVQQDTLH